MLHIANCTLYTHYYQGETNKEEINHIVDASSYEDCLEKLEKHYKSKNIEGYVSYEVNVNYANEIIV